MDKVTKIVVTIGPKLFSIFEQEIPQVIAEPKLRSLFFAILTRSLTKSLQDGYVLTSEEWIAYYVDEYAAYHSDNHKRFTAIKFLQALKNTLPSEWEMEWTNFDYTQNKARTTRIKPPNHIIELLYQDIRDRPTPRYYVYKWGTKVTKDSCNFTTEALQQIQESHIQEVKCSLQEDILSYTNSRNIREFRYMNIQAAKDVIETYPVGKKEYYSHTLNTIIDYPKPIYHPVEACYRLFAPGLQFLKSDIRLALYPNSIELDLKSCHLAILAMLLDLNHTKEVLLGETSAWTHLLTHTARFISPFFYPLLKKAIKTTIYSLCFGASPLASKKIFKEKLISEGFTPTDIKPLWKAFTQIELVQELMVKTYTWRNQLLQDGEYIDPFGITHKVTGQNDVKTACFNICSAYELILIHPVYKVAQEELSKNRPLFRIMLHSHDGVTVSLAKPHLLKPVVKRLSEAVQEVAQNLNIYTTLEHKVIT